MIRHTIVRRISVLLTAIMMLIGSGLVVVSGVVHAEVGRLLKVTPVVLPGNRVQIRFDFTHSPPLPQAQLLAQSTELVLDFWGVENDSPYKIYPMQAGLLHGVEIGQTVNRLRAKVRLEKETPFRLFSEGNSVFLELNPYLKGVGNPSPPMLRKTARDKPPVAVPVQLQGMVFDQDGTTGRVILTLSDDRAGLDLVQEGNNVLVNLLGASLSPAMEKRLDVQRFDTPIMFLDAFRSDGNVSVLIKPSAEPYQFSAYQMDNKLVLELRPEPELLKFRDELAQSGTNDSLLTLNLQRVKVRTILQILAEAGGRNLVISDSVDGDTSLRLINVPWQQALRMVIRKEQLEKRQMGDVVLILSKDEEALINSPERVVAAKPVKPVKVKPVSVRTEIMPVHNSRASLLKEQLLQASLLSPQGRIDADDQLNSLVVRDNDAARERIREVLSKLDVMVYKSLILETQLVAAPYSVANQLGVRWSNVAPAGSGLQVGFRSGDGMLKHKLEQLRASGQLALVSQSRRRMQSGDEVSLERSRDLTRWLGRGSNYQDTVLSLDVMSRIQQGGRILMDVNVARDVLSDYSETGEMSISNNELVSSVVVPDGDSLVLTGFARPLPGSGNERVVAGNTNSVLGNQAYNTENSNNQTELLIFITPILAGSSQGIN